MITPPWVAMMQAHADQAQARLEFADDDHATQNLDHAIRHGRRAGIENPARDIATAAVDDTIGRPARHRRHGSLRTSSECGRCFAATYTLAEHQARTCKDCQR